MFMVLSEINCLDTLKKMGVHPDCFYTDYELFKNKIVGYSDVKLVVILAGSCAFNKRHTIEFIKTLVKRAKDSGDIGIKKIHVVTDTSLSNLSTYFKYTGHLSNVDKYSGWKLKERNYPLWEALKCPEVDTEVHLSGYDVGDSSRARKLYEDRYNSEDEYIKLIKVPNVKEMLAARAG